MYKVISISGTDAADFLQGQLTQDVAKVPPQGHVLAAWCNPKGRVFVIIRLFQLDDAIGLAVPDGIADAVSKRLVMYRLRSRVDITTLEGVSPAYDTEEENVESLIRAGIPTIDETNSEKFTPHMLNLDKLGAISFSKGCYTGQEVVARTENLGRSKRRMMIYAVDKEGVTTGDKLSDGDRNVGEVVNAARSVLLAVTPIDLHGQSLVVNGTTVTPLGLPYSI